MTNEENQKFTKLHKFLFTDNKFKAMKAKSKLLYAIITERQSLTIAYAKNNQDQSQFLDENNRLFSIYSNSDLKGMLHVSEPTIISLKKELIENGLLEEIRVPNANNRLYPKKPYDEYFYANDLDEFYRLPHSIFDNPKYKKIAADSITAYAIYLSRYEYSVFKDSFYDKENKLYCICTNEEIANLLNIDRRKVAKIKNELVACGLLAVKPSLRADLLYVSLPEVSHGKELKKMHIGNLKKCTLETKENAHWKLKKMHTSYTYFSYTYSSDTDISDMNNMNEDNINVKDNSEVEKPNHSNNTNHCSTPFSKDFNINQVEQEILLQQLPNDIQINLKHFSNDEISCIKGVLNKAKANHNYNTPIEERITYEDCSYEIGEALKRIKYYSIQRNENIKNLEAYMMQSFKRVFADYIQDQYTFDDEEKYDIGNIESFVPQNKMQAEAKRRFLF